MNYNIINERGFSGFGKDLAPLTTKGITQAERVSKNPVLKQAELIASFLYTRALQTASIISKNIGLDINVKINLHEWLPDMTFQYKTSSEAFALFHDYYKNKGPYSIKKW